MVDVHLELKSWLSNGHTPACLAVFSPDRTRRSRALAYAIEEISKTGKFRVESIDCAELNLDKLRTLEANFKTLSLFAESKILHLHGLNQLKKDLVPFATQLLSLANPQNIIILSDAPLAKKVAASALISKAIKSISFPALEDTALVDWVQRETKRLKLAPLPEKVIQELTQSSENDVDEIASRLEKISLYSDSPEVSFETYQELFPLKVFGNDYKLIETLVSGNRKQSEYLATLSINEKSQPLGLLALLNKTTSQVSQLRLASPQSPAPQIQPWLLQKYRRLAQNLSVQNVSRAFISLASADFRLKDKNLGPAHVFSKISQLFAHR